MKGFGNAAKQKDFKSAESQIREYCDLIGEETFVFMTSKSLKLLKEVVGIVRREYYWIDFTIGVDGSSNFVALCRNHSAELHNGIDHFIDRIVRLIAVTQFEFDNPFKILITNDGPEEKSYGLTSQQSNNLKKWLNSNSTRIPRNFQISILRIEDVPIHRRLFKLPDFTKNHDKYLARTRATLISKYR